MLTSCRLPPGIRSVESLTVATPSPAATLAAASARAQAATCGAGDEGVGAAQARHAAAAGAHPRAEGGTAVQGAQQGRGGRWCIGLDCQPRGGHCNHRQTRRASESTCRVLGQHQVGPVGVLEHIICEIACRGAKANGRVGKALQGQQGQAFSRTDEGQPAVQDDSREGAAPWPSLPSRATIFFPLRSSQLVMPGALPPGANSAAPAASQGEALLWGGRGAGLARDRGVGSIW